jgi:putative ABC transport system permease protein
MKRIGEIIFLRASRETHMLQSIIKSAVRNIQKRRINNLLSIIGLTVGFSSFILISMFIKYELSWDAYHENYDRIFRIQTDMTTQGEKIMQTSPALSLYLKNRLTDIEKQCIVMPNAKLFIAASEETESVEEEGQYADQGYLDIFTFNFIYGSPSDALQDPMSVVISSSLSEKLFQDSNPVGKTLLLQKKNHIKITGVYHDLPKDSHLRPDFIISFSSLEVLWNQKDIYDQWDWNAFFTYVLLKRGADHKNVDSSIRYVLKNKVLTDHRELYLRPLSKLYMYSTNDNYLVVIYILTLFSFFVLILASINFVNLSIASSSIRAKEIGVKKVIGSSRRLLMLQVFIESFIVTIFSFLLSLVIVEILLNSFNHITDKDMTFSILFQKGFIFILLAFILLTSIISSIYPTFIITSIRSIDLFKNNIGGNKKSRISLKKALVGFQFTVSIILITLTILISKQIHYTQTMDIGFKKNNLLFAEINPSEKDATLSQVKNRLAYHPELKFISASGGFPIHSSIYVGLDMMNWEGSARNEVTEVRTFRVSHDFIKTLDLEIINGREFSEAFPSDLENGCIINETAVRQFGWKDPIGKYLDDRQMQVIGVIKDMHFHDMYNVIKPLAIRLTSDQTKINGPVFFAFRVDSDNMQHLKKEIESTLKEIFPMDPFEIKEFEDHFTTAEIFEVYETINSIFGFFALVAVILSILGVIGLVNHSLNRRTKEIAIRKISGCSSLSMFVSISMEYLALILISTLAGALGSGYLYKLFPINYPFELSIMDFLYAGIIILILTIFSTGHKTWRESTRNPVQALRYE